jgi:hypothetical protein
MAMLQGPSFSASAPPIPFSTPSQAMPYAQIEEGLSREMLPGLAPPAVLARFAAGVVFLE